MHTAPQRALDCRSGLGRLNQVYWPNCPTPSVYGIRGEFINIFTRCTIRNQHDILKTAVADVSKDLIYTMYAIANMTAMDHLML